MLHITLHFYYKVSERCISSHFTFVLRSILFDIKHGQSLCGWVIFGAQFRWEAQGGGGVVRDVTGSETRQWQVETSTSKNASARW